MVCKLSRKVTVGRKICIKFYFIKYQFRKEVYIMSVKKIFVTLIVIVACVIVGAVVLNFLVPNATKAVVNAVETQIQNATGMQFDFNGDGDNNYSTGEDATQEKGAGTNGAGVNGID